LELLLGLLAELTVGGDQLAVNALDVVLQRRVAREEALAEDAFKGSELHVDALRMVF